MRIEACFDSHVHWVATGDFSSRLKLSTLTAAKDILNIKPDPSHFRGDWLIGYGWDDTKWPDKPTRETLDRWCSDGPVALSRCDGHCLWLNSAAIKRAGLYQDLQVPGGRIDLEAGLVLDQASELIHKLIPSPSSFELRRQMLKAVQIFNEQGFTHIRDMTCDETQWSEAIHLDETGLLTMAVEEFFWLKSITNLERLLQTLKSAQKSQTNNLRVKGIKIFLDGALGSEGALLSKCYHGSDSIGLRIWPDDSLQEVFIKTWELGFDVAVHAIGDQAVDIVVDTIRQYSKPKTLHIEHGQIIRPETIQKMQGLPIEVHLQPSHWLSDVNWLTKKIGDLAQYSFPWRKLQEHEIKFDFGSDSPIESASVERTIKALQLSAEGGTPRLLGSPEHYLGHRDLAWAPNSYTVFDENYRPTQVVFRGEHLI